MPAKLVKQQNYSNYRMEFKIISLFNERQLAITNGHLSDDIGEPGSYSGFCNLGCQPRAGVHTIMDSDFTGH